MQAKLLVSLQKERFNELQHTNSDTVSSITFLNRHLYTNTQYLKIQEGWEVQYTIWVKKYSHNFDSKYLEYKKK